MTAARKAVAVLAVAIPIAVASGIAIGWFASDLAPALRSPLGARYFDAALGIFGSAAFAVSAALFSRTTGFRSWLPPVMLLAPALDLFNVPSQHPILVGIAVITWLLALAVRSARWLPVRIAAVIVCGTSMATMHAIAALRA